MRTRNLTFLSFVFCLFCSFAWAQEPMTLALGQRIEREIAGGESHTYQIPLTAGQFMYTEVEQKGIDVTATLLSPSGQGLGTTDSPNSACGIEPVVVVAETFGTYRLEISSLTRQARPGRYVIRLVTLRDATNLDREHVTAERAFAEAQKLRLQRASGWQQAAIEKYQQALPFYQASGDAYRQALTLYIIGNIHANAGTYRQAVDDFSQAHTILRGLEDPCLEGTVLNYLGGAWDVLGDPALALSFYEQALPMTRATGDRRTEGSILNNIGKIQADQADFQAALNNFTAALALYRAIADKQGEALALDNIGTAWYSSGEMARALTFHEQALALRRAVNNKQGEGRTLQRIGVIQSETGAPDKAMETFNLALLLHQSVGDRSWEASTLKHMGSALATLGQPEKALEALQQSLPLRRALEDRRGTGLTLNSLGRVYRILKQYDKAIESYQQALTIFGQVGDRHNEATALVGLAQAQRDRGNVAEARRQIETALSLFETVRASLDSQESRASYFAGQQSAFQFYTDLLMQLRQQEPAAGHEATALAVSERARARSLLEILTDARLDFRAGGDAALLERERTLLQQINARAAKLMQRNSPEQVSALKKELNELEDEYQMAQAKIRKASPHHAALTQPQPLKLKEIQQQLDADTLLLEYSLGAERSYLWAITKETLTSYELPKEELIKQSALQVYELLTARNANKRSETPTDRRARLAQAEANLPAAAQTLSQQVLGPVAAQLGTKRLVIVADGALQYIPFAMLPEPVVGDRQSVIGEKEVVGDRQPVVGNNANANRPPTTDHRPPLIVKHEIISLPSASMLAIQRTELAGRQPAPKLLAVIADPVFDRTDERFKAAATAASEPTQAPTISFNDARSIEHLAEKPDDKASVTTRKLVIPRLPFTRREATQLLALTPKNASFSAMDFQANRMTALDPALSQYRYVHFATHGLLDSERPGLSSLVLSMVDAQGKAQDGFLRANDIYNLKLPAELVVLSACQTGLGKDVKGEGLVGLTRGFMYAGAARVVVSLWSVNDRATADLMTKFYEKMLKQGERPVAALRAAQVEMWKQRQWQSPFYWAAFVMQGEWK